ncbi:MAG: helix-turn-helix domain-containing protein [Acidobacteria bacterium]|nr:helix-turn-helix domain-containing protein [Acidobacteriota bacterium]
MSKSRQGKNTTISNYPGMWERITDALATIRTNEIASALEVSVSLVSDWKAGRAFPTLVHLFKIAEIGHTSLDWIVTGESPRNLEIKVDDQLTSFSGIDRRFILSLANENGATIEETVRRLVNDGLAAHGHVKPELEELREADWKTILLILKRIDNMPRADSHNFGMKLINLVVNKLIRTSVKDRQAEPQDFGTVDEFDFSRAMEETNDPHEIMRRWFTSEGREYPEDFGVVFFQGWESFSEQEKLDAINDAKKVLDRTLKSRKGAKTKR